MQEAEIILFKLLDTMWAQHEEAQSLLICQPSSHVADEFEPTVCHILRSGYVVESLAVSLRQCVYFLCRVFIHNVTVGQHMT